MSDDTKAAPSLADVAYAQIAHRREEGCKDVTISLAHYGECAAALRAVEAVRALHSPSVRVNAVDWCPVCRWQYYPCATLRALDGVEAVQALLEGEK